MKPLSELIDKLDPAMPIVHEWISRAVRPVEILPASDRCGEVLFHVQVTTRSPMGAVAFETGGILVDNGWLRILGSGSPRLTRTLPEWNAGRTDGFYLVADDAMGGFFAINGGSFGADVKSVYYLAPDTLRWEPMQIGYSEFLIFAFCGKFDEFYRNLRWPGWEKDISKVHGDRCLTTYPPLFTIEGRTDSAVRFEISAREAWGMQMEFRKQFSSG